MKKAHICLITTGSIEQTFGGEEKFTLALSKWLLADGFLLTVLYKKSLGIGVADDISDLRTPQKTQVRHSVIGAPLFLYQLHLYFFSFLCLLKMLQVNKRKQISVVHAQDTRQSGLSAVLFGKLMRVPVVIHSHGHAVESFDGQMRGKRDKGIRRLYMLCLRSTIIATHNFVIKRASEIIAVSENVKRRLSNEIHGKTRILLAPIGINIEYFYKAVANRLSLRTLLSIETDDFVVGFVGRLSPEKNVLTLIRAFGMLLQKNKHAKMVIVGDGPIKGSLKALVQQLEISSSVIFTGFRNDVADILSAIDVFVLPSYVEGCPTALIEALACGRAIIASSISGVKQIIIDGVNGLLFNPLDQNELRDALLLLSENTELRENLMNLAQLTSWQFDEKTLYKKIELLYALLI